MKYRKGLAFFVIVTLAIVLMIFFFLRSQKAPVSTSINSSEQTKSTDLTTIRSFMEDPDLELAYIGTDLPQPYFMVGKVSELPKGGGINIE